jgi:hypothetical protein
MEIDRVVSIILNYVVESGEELNLKEEKNDNNI